MNKSENKYFIKDNIPQYTLKYVLKRVINEIRVKGYKVLFKGIHPKVKEKKYKVSICAIFKNEASYLKEWLEYNHLVGIEHFYLYNNNSEDDYLVVLAPYIERGWVTLIDWPYNQMQMESYKDCIKKYAKETKWLGFIDIDEFIVPRKTDNIYEFLKQFENNRGSVNIYWRLYGTSGLIERDVKGLVIEDFITCWPKYCDIGKCFYNTAFDFNEKSEKGKLLHHRFWANWRGLDIPPVNVFDHVCIGDINKADTGDFPIQINHYFTKSYNEYRKKCAKGDVYFKINPHDEEYFYEHEMKCTSTDYSAYKYLVKLKMAMEES